MTVPEVLCKTVAMQNNSQRPCSLCPIPQLRLVGVRKSYIYLYYFPDTLSSGPHYKSLFGGPPGCTLLPIHTFGVVPEYSHALKKGAHTHHPLLPYRSSPDSHELLPSCHQTVTYGGHFP